MREPIISTTRSKAKRGRATSPPPAKAPRALELESLGSLLSRAYNNYAALVTRVLDERGLGGRVQFGVGNALFALYARDNRTISEVGDELGVTRSTMTGCVTRMKAAGLIATSPDPKDGRATRLSLTPAARALERDLKEAASSINQQVCGEFSEGQEQTLRKMLARMIDAMNQG